MRFYAGIGSRETPQSVLQEMTRIAEALSMAGYVLRSGGADGADTAFEKGAQHAEIYLPWAGFNGNASPLFGPRMSRQCMTIAAEHHPNWGELSDAARKLHARNTAQVLGPQCDAFSDFVVCWTKNGKGGTGQAIRVARHYNIPVYDLGVLSLEYVSKKISHHIGAHA